MAPPPLSSTSSKVDYYAILGLTKDTNENEIKKSYYKLAKKWHPDKNKSAGAEEKFKEICKAYEILSDSSKRRLYDLQNTSSDTYKYSSSSNNGTTTTTTKTYRTTTTTFTRTTYAPKSANFTFYKSFTSTPSSNSSHNNTHSTYWSSNASRNSPPTEKPKTTTSTNQNDDDKWNKFKKSSFESRAKSEQSRRSSEDLDEPQKQTTFTSTTKSNPKSFAQPTRSSWTANSKRNHYYGNFKDYFEDSSFFNEEDDLGDSDDSDMNMDDFYEEWLNAKARENTRRTTPPSQDKFSEYFKTKPVPTTKTGSSTARESSRWSSTNPKTNGQSHTNDDSYFSNYSSASSSASMSSAGNKKKPTEGTSDDPFDLMEAFAMYKVFSQMSSRLMKDTKNEELLSSLNKLMNKNKSFVNDRPESSASKINSKTTGSDRQRSESTDKSDFIFNSDAKNANSSSSKQSQTKSASTKNDGEKKWEFEWMGKKEKSKESNESPKTARFVPIEEEGDNHFDVKSSRPSLIKTGSRASFNESNPRKSDSFDKYGHDDEDDDEGLYYDFGFEENDYDSDPHSDKDNQSRFTDTKKFDFSSKRSAFDDCCFTCLYCSRQFSDRENLLKHQLACKRLSNTNRNSTTSQTNFNFSNGNIQKDGYKSEIFFNKKPTISVNEPKLTSSSTARINIPLSSHSVSSSVASTNPTAVKSRAPIVSSSSTSSANLVTECPNCKVSMSTYDYLVHECSTSINRFKTSPIKNYLPSSNSDYSYYNSTTGRYSDKFYNANKAQKEIKTSSPPVMTSVSSTFNRSSLNEGKSCGSSGCSSIGSDFIRKSSQVQTEAEKPFESTMNAKPRLVSGSTPRPTPRIFTTNIEGERASAKSCKISTVIINNVNQDNQENSKKFEVNDNKYDDNLSSHVILTPSSCTSTSNFKITIPKSSSTVSNQGSLISARSGALEPTKPSTTTTSTLLINVGNAPSRTSFKLNYPNLSALPPATTTQSSASIENTRDELMFKKPSSVSGSLSPSSSSSSSSASSTSSSPPLSANRINQTFISTYNKPYTSSTSPTYSKTSRLSNSFGLNSKNSILYYHPVTTSLSTSSNASPLYSSAEAKSFLPGSSYSNFKREQLRTVGY